MGLFSSLSSVLTKAKDVVVDVYEKYRGVQQEIAATTIGQPVIISPVSAAAVVPKKVISTVAKAATSVVKSVIPKTTKGKVATATAGLIGYGVVKESPTAKEFVKEKVASIPSIPGKAIDLGTDIGKVIEKDKTLDKTDIYKAAKTVGIVGAAAATAAVVVPKVIEKVKEAKEEKEQAVEEVKTFTPQEPQKESQLVSEKPVGAAEQPLTPATTTISTGKKRYKRRRAKKTPSVRQYVRVNVVNSAVGQKITNRKYLKVTS